MPEKKTEKKTKKGPSDKFVYGKDDKLVIWDENGKLISGDPGDGKPKVKKDKKESKKASVREEILKLAKKVEDENKNLFEVEEKE